MQSKPQGFADIDGDGMDVLMELTPAGQPQYVSLRCPADYYCWEPAEARQIANLILALAGQIDCPHYLSEMGCCVGCGKAI